MTKEQLLELGLSEEQIKEVFKLNGIAVNNAKGDLATKETELETKDTEIKTLQRQLETANKEIESFKELDIEEIKQRAEDYKKKFEDAEKKAKEDLEKLKFDHLLEKALTGARAKNAIAVKALLDMEGLKLNNDEIVGLNEQLEKIKEENDYLFEVEDTDPAPKFTTKTNRIVDNDTKKFNITDILEKANIRK